MAEKFTFDSSLFAKEVTCIKNLNTQFVDAKKTYITPSYQNGIIKSKLDSTGKQYDRLYKKEKALLQKTSQLVSNTYNHLAQIDDKVKKVINDLNK